MTYPRFVGLPGKLTMDVALKNLGANPKDFDFIGVDKAHLKTCRHYGDGIEGFFVQVKRPVTVFKKLRNSKIGRLILIPGEPVFCTLADTSSDFPKCRTSVAYVQSVRNKNRTIVKRGGVSLRSPHFLYVPHSVVTPMDYYSREVQSMSMDSDACDSGIHFFFQEARALKYS
jgi:hypothetical protein